MIKHDPTSNSPHTPSIHILDDYSILHIFYLYRPAMLGEGEDDYVRLRGGQGWDRERWWYRLAHVCQRWRNIILGSASYLKLCLVCTYGTPVATMLERSPPLPIVIDYPEVNWDITSQDEEGIMLALEHHDRIRRVRFWTSVPKLQKFIMAFDKDFPGLEYLIMAHSEVESTALILPETLQAPHLRHLLLAGFSISTESLLITAAVGLVTLTLTVPLSAYFEPNALLQRLSFMPQLETVLIDFLSPVPSDVVEKQAMHSPITAHVTLPRLRWFSFRGVSAYLEEIIHRITSPRLEKLSIEFFEEVTFSVSRLLQFMNTTKNLRFNSAQFKFSSDDVDVEVHPHEDSEPEMYALSLRVRCNHLDRQVFSVAQIFNPLSQILTTVEHLTFEREVHDLLSEEDDEVDRAAWHKLFRSFSKVKTLHVGDGLVEEVSRSLRLEDGELPVGVLPELQELRYSGSGDNGDAFTSFTDARQNADCPVTLVLGQARPVIPAS